MATMKVLTCITILVNFLNVCISANLPCQPRPQIFPMKQGDTFYHDQSGEDHINIELYRCSGNVEHNHPEAYQCVPNANDIQEIQLEVLEYGIFPPYEEMTQLKFQNHTSCTVKCVCERHGSCPADSIYTPTCEEGKIWDKKQCGCKNIFQDCLTGEGGPSSGISLTMFIIALAIEFIIVLVVVFLVMDVCKYRRHGKGLIYKTSQYVRHLSTAGTEGFKITTLKRREATGSVSFLYEVNNEHLPNGKPV